MMDVAILFLMNFIVGISAFLIAARLFNFVNLADTLACWFIVFFAHVVLSELLLGGAGWLYLENVLLCNIVILLVVWLITKNKPSPKISGQFIIDKLQVLLKNKVAFIGFAALLGFVSVKLAVNLVNPPFGWDNLNYHFVFPVEWLKTGTLHNPITVFDDPAPTYYPINGSLLFLWFMFPLKDVMLADVAQFPFFVLAFLMVYSISRKIGVSKTYSFYAALLFLFVPNVFKQLEVAYVDMMVAALFLAGVNFLILLQQDFSLRNTLMYALSVGLLVGTKTLALPYGILLVLPFLYYSLKQINKFKLFLSGIAVIVAFGGFTYIRNFIETGNPFYPLQIKLFAHTVFKGVIDASAYRAHTKVYDYTFGKLFFHEGLGSQSVIFVIPALVFGVPMLFLKRLKVLKSTGWYILMLPYLLYLEYRFLIPLANTRYLYPCIGLSFIVAFFCIQALSVRRLVVQILVSLCLMISMNEVSKYLELLNSYVLTGVMILVLLGLSRIRPATAMRRGTVFVFFLGVVFLTVFFLNKDYLNREYPRYKKMLGYSGFWPNAVEAWGWLNRVTTGNSIAYAGRPVAFPLYGTGFKNIVQYVSVNRIDPAELHYFPDSYYRWGSDFMSLHRALEEKGNYRSDPEYAVWLGNLNRRKVEYLFVYSLHQTEELAFPIEDRWAKEHPEVFNPVFANETVHIYKCHYSL